MLRQIRALGRGLVRVWAWLVVRATTRRIARPTREVRALLAEELLAAAQRTRELLSERAATAPAERRTEPLPPVSPDLSDPMPPTRSAPAPKEPRSEEPRSEDELAIIRFHQIKDVLSPHPDRRTHVECECGWKCDAATRKIAWEEYDEHVKDAVTAFHRLEKTLPLGAKDMLGDLLRSAKRAERS